MHHEERFTGPAVLGVASFERDRLGGLRCALCHGESSGGVQPGGRGGAGAGDELITFGEVATKPFALCRDCMAMLTIDYDLGPKEVASVGSETGASVPSASATVVASSRQGGAAAATSGEQDVEAHADIRIELLDGHNLSHVLAYAYPIAKPPKLPRWWKRSRGDGHNRTAGAAAGGTVEQARESGSAYAAGSGGHHRRLSEESAAATPAAASVSTRQRSTIVRWLPAGKWTDDAAPPDDAFWRAQSYRTRRASPDHLLQKVLKRVPGVRYPKQPNFELRTGQLVRLRLKLYGTAKLYSFQWVK